MYVLTTQEKFYNIYLPWKSINNLVIIPAYFVKLTFQGFYPYKSFSNLLSLFFLIILLVM